MPWDLFTTVYELKGNFSAFLRAISRGAADAITVKRYKRPVALIVPLGNRNKPALEPETEGDRLMRARTHWDGRDSVSRRPPPLPKWP